MSNDLQADKDQIIAAYEHELIKSANGWKVSKMKFNLKYQDGNKSLPMLASKK